MTEQKTKTILIADDELDLRDALEAILTSEGYTTRCVENGEEAFEVYHTEHPDLLVLDLNMPKKSGMEVLRQIRSEEGDQGVPIIILTAHADMDRIADATAIGGMKTDFLSKTDKSLADIVKHVAQRLGE